MDDRGNEMAACNIPARQTTIQPSNTIITNKKSTSRVVPSAVVAVNVPVRINSTAGKNVLVDGLITALHLVDLHGSPGEPHYHLVVIHKKGIPSDAHERDIGKHSGKTE